MECNECINKIDSFIHGTLNLKEASDFAKHVKSCDECYNELEINYCLQTAVSELRNDSVLTGDFTEKLRLDLEKAYVSYYIQKADSARKRLLIVLFIIAVGIYAGINIF